MGSDLLVNEGNVLGAGPRQEVQGTRFCLEARKGRP